MQSPKSKVQSPKFQHKRGYTLLFAVLTAALVLGVAVFILSVSKKQFALSVAARDSMYSLYAADSAMECAAASTISTTSQVVISCVAGSPSTADFDPIPSGALDQTVWPSASATYQANLLIPLNNETCARVTITDGDYDDGTGKKHKMIIDSRGYNYCDDLGPKASYRTVERALRLTYR